MSGPGRRQALLLVGHGSSVGSGAGEPVRLHAERIRRLGAFDEVAVAFVKEAPRLEGALASLTSDDVYVVPFFLAEGYYTQSVVPAALGLTGRTARIGGRVVRYCRAVGTHPGMARLVLRRALRALAREGRTPADAVLMVIGHGTERHARSGTTTERLTAWLAARSGFRDVVCGFLDQEPRVESVVRQIDADCIVLVPFMVAAGMHTRETIPEVLELTGARTRRSDGRVLWYTPPVGVVPEAARVVLSVARRAGARVYAGATAAPAD